MAITAERRTDSFEDIVATESWRPLLLTVPEMASDELTKQRAANFIGSLALDSAVQYNQASPTESYSLLGAVRRAAEGDAAARAMVQTNVRTDVVERTIKSGHVTKVKLETDDYGRVLQHGQTAADIQANSLRFASGNWQMRARTEAETRNMFRIDEINRQGLLDDYAFVVFSRAADDMSPREMADSGFFTDTMSCAIQVTTAERGQLTVESAFVAGKQSWDAERHDADTVARIGDVLGADFTDKTATETLDTPLLIHKSLMPNGVIDVVKLYDEVAGGTFFGEAKSQHQDYLAYRQLCAERETAFEPRVQAITRQLIAEAASLTSPRHASQRLGKLSQHEMLEHSIRDTSIDARVFGQAAAYQIEQARFHYEAGQHDKAQQLASQAQRVARSSSCPGGVSAASKQAELGESDNQTDSKEDEKLEDCDFISKECPKCHKKNVKTLVRNGKYYGACGCHS